MTDEIKDGFNRLRELAESIGENLDKPKDLTARRIKYLISCIDVLETEIEFTEK